MARAGDARETRGADVDARSVEPASRSFTEREGASTMLFHDERRRRT
jgi:hypothetical protein